MATSKVERLMNLVIALLSTSSYLTAEKIRKNVAGYSDSASDEAFSRMFERDKNELRDLGIPLETGKISSFDATEGYRINRKDYALPAVELTAEESASVAVATQLWQSPEMVTATQNALLKLRAAGVDVDSEDAGVAFTSTAALPGLRGSEEVLGVLLAASNSGRVVQFEHRASRNDPYRTRTVEPWGVVTHRGRWYLVGHDRDREDTRTFRLSRITGARPVGAAGAVTPPHGVNLRRIVQRVVADVPTGERARVWIAQGRATALRRQATSSTPRVWRGRAGEEITVDLGTYDRLAREIASYGTDAVALDPPQLRDDVVARLRAQADHAMRPSEKPEADRAMRPSEKPEADRAMRPSEKPEADRAMRPSEKPEADRAMRPSEKPEADRAMRPSEKPEADRAMRPSEKPEADRAMRPSEKPEADRA